MGALSGRFVVVVEAGRRALVGRQHVQELVLLKPRWSHPLCAHEPSFVTTHLGHWLSPVGD